MRLQPADHPLVPPTANRSSLCGLGLEKQRDWRVSEQAGWSLALYHCCDFVIGVLRPHCRALTVYQLEIDIRIGEIGHRRHVDPGRRILPILAAVERMHLGME